MNRKLTLALAALMLTSIFCGPTPTPPPYQPPPQPGVPPDHNSADVDGSSGTPAEGIPVDCGTETGNVNIPAGSFSGSETISIDCVSESEQTQLDQAVEDATGQTGEVLGAIKLSPPGMQFDSFVTITIPLIRRTGNQYVNVYIYDEDSENMYDVILQARVECSGWCAKASVDHFTTFIAYESEEITATEPPVFLCTDPLGCVTYAPGESIRLATLLAYTGGSTESLAISVDNEEGFLQAISSYGEIEGHTIEFKSFDEGCNPDRAYASAKEIVEDVRIAGVVGTVCSASADSALSILSGEGYTMISPANSRTSLTAPGIHQEGYFRVSIPDSVEAQGMALYAYKDLEMRYISVVYEDNESSKGLAETFSAKFQELGGKILDNEPIFDFALYREKLKVRIASGEGPEAIYFPLPTLGGAFASMVTEDFGDSITFLGMSSMTFNYDYVDTFEFGKYLTHYPRIAPYPREQAVDYGYDATALLIEAIAKVTVLEPDGTMHIGRQALRDALYATRDFSGRTGSLSCNQFGDCATPALIEIYRYESTGELSGDFIYQTSIFP